MLGGNLAMKLKVPTIGPHALEDVNPHFYNKHKSIYFSSSQTVFDHLNGRPTNNQSQKHKGSTRTAPVSVKAATPAATFQKHIISVQRRPTLIQEDHNYNFCD